MRSEQGFRELRQLTQRAACRDALVGTSGRFRRQAASFGGGHSGNIVPMPPSKLTSVRPFADRAARWVSCAPVLALMLGAWLLVADAGAQPSVAAREGALTAVATVVGASGDSSLLRTASLVSPVRPGTSLTSGDRVQTRADGRVELRFTDGSVVALQPNTEFRIDDYRLETGAQRNFMTLLRGALRVVSGAIGKFQRDDYRLTTPSAVIGIRGTEYEVDETVCPARGCAAGVRAGLAVRVIQGRVWVTNDSGSVEVPTGGSVFVADRQSLPTPPRQPTLSLPSTVSGQALPASGQPATPASLQPAAPARAPLAAPVGAPPAVNVPAQVPSPWVPSATPAPSVLPN